MLKLPPDQGGRFRLCRELYRIRGQNRFRVEGGEFQIDLLCGVGD